MHAPRGAGGGGDASSKAVQPLLLAKALKQP
jgi:hypothetical protein